MTSKRQFLVKARRRFTREPTSRRSTEHLIGYWLGHKDSSMNGHYDRSPTQYKSWRKEWAEKTGCGFELPVKLGVVGPIGPNSAPTEVAAQEVANGVAVAA